MKCPKCEYLGFETGDRCKNCGYDFSLLTAPKADPVELSLEPPASETVPVGDLWLDRESDRGLAGPASPEPVLRMEPLSLFSPAGADDDEPLVKLPAEPRAPLAVRRAPETTTRSRPASKTPRKIETGLALEFAEEADLAPPPAPPAREVRSAVVAPARRVRESTIVASLGSRAVAALIDHAILLGVDAVVVYGTLKMTALTLSDWPALPALPLLGFLALLKLSYFASFTAMGGQTIGKMAAGIRVVADPDLKMDPPRAISRTLTGALSLLSLGLGLIPALVGPDRRAFHDRVAHTRVVELPSA